MLKNLTPTNKIHYPVLKLVNQNSITSNSSINIEVTAKNASSYQINIPFNQDTAFTPLILNNNQFPAQLDTGYNLILVRFIGQQDTVTLTKEVYYLPDMLMSQNTYNVSINANPASIGTKVYVNNQFIKEVNTFTDTIPALAGQNAFSFTRFGYLDSLITVDSAQTINLSLQLFPYSYSSLTDSNIVDFPAYGRLQYRRNLTMLDSAQTSIISIKQFDDNFSGMGFVPKSRKFEFCHLNAPAWSNIKTAMVLDQIDNLSVDSIYLMKVSDDTAFTKITFDNSGNEAGYDSLVQKLTYNYINFDSGKAKKGALVIMKKQAPVVNNISALSVKENDSLRIPLSQFFSDPDSVHGDMIFQVPDLSPTGLHLSVSNGNLLVNTNPCFSGNTSFSIQATHDGLVANNTISIKVVAAPIPVVNTSGPTSFCQGNSLLLSSDAAINNQWYKDGVAISDSTRTTLNVTSSGTYTVKIIVNGCESPASNTIAVTVNPIPAAPVITTGAATTVCAGGIVTLTSNAATGNQWLNNGIVISDSTNTTLNANASGSYTVRVTANGCESAASDTIMVTVNPTPPTPTITQNGSQLLSTATTGNQWHLNGVSISGGTGQTFAPIVSGNYTVQITVNNCTSNFSNTINFVVTSIPDLNVFDNQVKVLPNPIKDFLIILRSNSNLILNIEIYDIQGRRLTTLSSNRSRTEIYMRKYAAGPYIIRIEDKRTKLVGKKVILKL